MYGWVVEGKTEKTTIIVNPVSTLKLFFENTMNKCELKEYSRAKHQTLKNYFSSNNNLKDHIVFDIHEIYFFFFLIMFLHRHI